MPEFRLRSTLWPGEVPANANGTVRPQLVNEPWLTVHYTGVNPNYGDPGDSATEIKGIQSYAKNAGKPWEYNYIIDNEGVVWEYAGTYQAAHSAGENGSAVGVLLLLGVNDDPSDAMVEAFRWWRYQLVARGVLADKHKVVPHKDMPGAATACPGARVMARFGELTTPWDNSPEPQPQPNPETEPQPQPEPQPNPTPVGPPPPPNWETNGSPIPWTAFGRGAQGEWVIKWQYALTVHQAPIVIDGDFGQQTEDATYWWQVTHRLPETKIADVTTARSLGFNAYEPAPPPPAMVIDFNAGQYGLYPLNTNKSSIREGSQGDLVRYLQSVMKLHVSRFAAWFQATGGADSPARNLYLIACRDTCGALAIDGDFGAKTAEAVGFMQEAFRNTNYDGRRIGEMTPDKVVGPAQTWPFIDSLADGQWK